MTGRPSKTRALALWQNGLRVGEWRLPPQGEPAFAYDGQWFESPACRSLSLSLPALEAHPVVRGQAVNHFFDNLLPDSEAIPATVQRRHMIDTAKKCGYGASAQALVDEVIAAAPHVVAAVQAHYPQRLAQRIFDGMLVAAAQLAASADAH